jgi:hypothetical protein
VGKVEDLLGLGAGQAVGAEVEEQEVVLGTARDELVAELDEARGDGVAVLLDLRFADMGSAMSRVIDTGWWGRRESEN